MAPKDDPESSSEQPKYGVDQEYCPLDSAPSFESTQVVGAGVGEKVNVGLGLGENVGSGLGEASLVVVAPPPQVQHMSFEEKSESS